MTPSTYLFDRDTALREDGPGRWQGELSDRWNVGPVPNGGYVLAVVTAALGRALPGREPLTVTAHYLRPAKPGAFTVAVDVARVGRTLATASASFVQAGKEAVRALGTFGALAEDAPRRVDARPPALPPVDACADRPPGALVPAIAHRFDQRYDPALLGWTRGERGGPMELAAWQRFADGRPPDVWSLPLFADAMPPPVFAEVAPGWVPTVELTVHVRARPAPGWLRSRFVTRVLQGGWLEEDGELWDAAGRLVAMSRQLAAVPRRG